MNKNTNTKQKKKHRYNKDTSVAEINKTIVNGVKKTNDFDVKNDSGNGDSDTASTTIITSPVDMMTSKDFQWDTNAHVEMIHQQLKDTIRVEKFRAAILHNQHLFKGKIVLDINCGVGLFSLFAAKAGASKVYSVDTSNVVCYMRKIVAANGYEGIIEVFKGKIEDIELPVKCVDIIISDWVGYALFFQSTCDAVIYARDKWLKPGGLIFPDQAKLFMVALEDTKHKNENIEWWKGVYGFNMKCLREVALKEPRYQLIKPQQVLSKQCPIKSLDLYKATKEDLRFRSKYMLPIQRSGHMDGIALYFHVYFTKSHVPIGFSTDPWSTGTNWMQTIFFLDDSLSVQTNSIYYGGIEMFSPKSPPDLSDMIVNLELLMGDPTQPDVDVEMSWHLIPPTALMGTSNTDDDIEPHFVAEDNVKTDVTLESSTVDCCSHAESSAKVKDPQAVRSENHVPVQSSTSCTNDIGSYTFTIGKHNYTCRKNRRNKNKHSKKG